MITWFQLLGDLCHIASFFFLIYRMKTSKSAAGISLKTQELYFLVFVARYLDLFTSHSLYLFVMKVLYIGASGGIVYVMRKKHPWNSTYETPTKEVDKFPHWQYAVLPCAALAFVINEGTIYVEDSVSLYSLGAYLVEVAWAFSIYLEAVAILPQLIVLQKDQLVEGLTGNYVACLGAYRALYIINWIYKAWVHPGYRHWIVWIAGVVQTAFYCDFFYYYIKSKIAGKNTVLPASV